MRTRSLCSVDMRPPPVAVAVAVAAAVATSLLTWRWRENRDSFQKPKFFP